MTLHICGIRAFMRALARQDIKRVITGVMSTLSEKPGRVCSRASLIEAAYLCEDEPDNAASCVRVAIYRLREQGVPIKAVGKRGYVLERAA